jgi:hypothetical protein
MRGFFFSVVLAFAAASAQAIEVGASECREASQFIGNAAQSRDNGASKEFFVGRLDDDLFLLESLAPEHRWFAHSADEARFLRDAVLEVFDFPRRPAEHAADFLADCLRLAGLGPDEGEPRTAREGHADWRRRT